MTLDGEPIVVGNSASINTQLGDTPADLIFGHISTNRRTGRAPAQLEGGSQGQSTHLHLLALRSELVGLQANAHGHRRPPPH